MALAQVLISWHESLEAPVTCSMDLYLKSVLQPFKLSAITVDDTKAGKLSGIAEKLSDSMSVAKEKLPQGCTALTLLIGNVDRSYMYFCDWKEFESLAQMRQGDTSTFMITRYEGNTHTYSVEQYKDFCSTHQLQPFKKRIARKRQNSAKPGVLQSSAIEPRDPDLPTPEGLTNPPFPNHKPEEIKVDPVFVHRKTFEERKDPPVPNPEPRKFPDPVNPAPIQRQNPEIQVPSANVIWSRQSDKQGHIKRSIEEASASVRGRLQETKMRVVPSPNLQQGQLGQAMSRKFADLLHNKEQTLSAQVQQYTGSLCTEVSSVGEYARSSESQCKASVQQYHAQVYQMHQDIDEMQQGLLTAVQKMSSDLEQALNHLEQRVIAITPPKIFPVKVTLGASVPNSNYCALLVVRWKTWNPGETKCVQVVTSHGLPTPSEVILSEEIEVVPFNCALPNSIDLREGSVSLLKQPIRITQEDLRAFHNLEWESISDAFNLEQHIALEYLITHDQITSYTMAQIKKLVRRHSGHNSKYYLAELPASS